MTPSASGLAPSRRSGRTIAAAAKYSYRHPKMQDKLSAATLWLCGFRVLREPGVIRVYVPEWVSEGSLKRITRLLDEGSRRWERYGRTLVGRDG